MRLLLDLTRRGDQFAGTVTRSDDQLCVRFVGVLELVAALEELEELDQTVRPASAAPTEATS